MNEILIWAIPPLSPQQSDLPHFLDNISIHAPPLLKIPFPDHIIRDNHKIIGRKTLSSWYFGSGSLESIYFDYFYTSKFQRFKIIIEPDLSDTSLHVLNMSKFISRDISIGPFNVFDYRICDDALVHFWNNGSHKAWGAFAGLTSAPFTNAVTRWNGYFHSLCPTSGRFVYRPYDGEGRSSCSNRIVVVDLF